MGTAQLLANRPVKSFSSMAGTLNAGDVLSVIITLRDIKESTRASSVRDSE